MAFTRITASTNIFCNWFFSLERFFFGLLYYFGASFSVGVFQIGVFSYYRKEIHSISSSEHIGSVSSEWSLAV